MPDPRRRSPAQIEASRRNGARSRGPTTPEGKARASRNALKHGLTAMHHLVLEDEAPSELEEMTARLMAEVAPMSEIEARIARRLAIAFWKGERAERIEVALFDAAPKLRPPQAGYQWEQADPLTTFDLRRFNAVRGYQAQQGREISRCLKELRALRKDALAECTDEPEDDAAKTNPGASGHPPTTTRPRRPKGPRWRPRNPRETNPSRRHRPMANSGRSTACRCSTCGASRAGIRSQRPGRAAAMRRVKQHRRWPGERPLAQPSPLPWRPAGRRAS